MATRTLRLTAQLLLAAEEYLKLAERPDAIIALQEIEEAGTRWSSRKSLPPIRLHPKLSRQRFIHHAVGWLSFLNRLQIPAKPAVNTRNDIQMMGVEFTDFMQKERGLRQPLIELASCFTVRAFLDRLCCGRCALLEVRSPSPTSIRCWHSEGERRTLCCASPSKLCASSLRCIFPLRRNAGVGAPLVSRLRSWLASRVPTRISCRLGQRGRTCKRFLQNATGGDRPAFYPRSRDLMALLCGLWAFALE